MRQQAVGRQPAVRTVYLGQPGHIAGRPPELSQREGNVACDVDLVETSATNVRAHLLAGKGTFPWKHHASVTVRFRLFLSPTTQIRTILEHRLGGVLLEEEEGGVHPSLCIPESVTIVAIGGQAAGAKGPGPVQPDRGSQVVQGGIDRLSKT